MDNESFAGLPMANEKLLYHASFYLGQREKPGPESNAWILRMIRQYNDGVFRWAGDDGEVAWCSIFMHLVAKQACAIIDSRTNAGATALARSWQYSGQTVRWMGLLDENGPRYKNDFQTWLPGDVAVFSRGKGWGHVALLCRIDEAEGVAWVMGGNQSNAVSVMPYSLRRLIDIRRLYIGLEDAPIA